MATEYKLSYTASAIDEKLGKVDENTLNISNIFEKIANLPQSDWDQNDETALDYIKNRTHYEYEDNGQVIFEGENVYFRDGMDYAVFGFNDQFELSYDTEYLVQVDDCIVTIRPGSYVELEPQYHSTIGTCIELSSYVLQIQFFAKTNYYLKISTIGSGTVLKQLDDKFVPDTILRFEIEETLELPDVELTLSDDGNGNVNIVTSGMEIVDDGNGNISITSEHLAVADDGNGNIAINV